MNKRPLRRMLLRVYVPICLLGILLLGSAGYIVTGMGKNAQVIEYNHGVASYQSLKLDDALSHFDKSLAAFQGATVSAAWRKFITPPDRVTAALAAHHKANILVRMKRFKEAVEVIQFSAKLNPGENYDLVRSFDNLTQREIDELMEQALTTRNVYELLMKSDAIRKAVQAKK